MTDKLSETDNATTAPENTDLAGEAVTSALPPGIDFATVPAPCTQLTTTWPSAAPPLPSCSVHGEAELNPAPDTNSTWPATGSEALQTLDIENWTPLCGEMELSAMPDVDHLWPFGARGAVSMSDEDWSALCGEVEISTMQNAYVPWMGSLGVEGFEALRPDGDRPNEGAVTNGQASSSRGCSS